MLADRIEVLLEPFLHGSSTPDGEGTETAAQPLSSRQLADISMYIDMLLRWNTRVNLTSIRDPEAIVTRHFGESLFVAQDLFGRLAGAQAFDFSHVIDVGAGAGFPGLPIKIWEPRIHLTLIESNQKKVAFLREVVRGLGLEDVTIRCSRAEELSLSGDIVTLRAVERFEQVLPVACGLIGMRGQIALLIGENQVEAARNLGTGLRWQTPIELPQSGTRVLLKGFRV